MAASLKSKWSRGISSGYPFLGGKNPKANKQTLFISKFNDRVDKMLTDG